MTDTRGPLSVGAAHPTVSNARSTLGAASRRSWLLRLPVVAGAVWAVALGAVLFPGGSIWATAGGLIGVAVALVVTFWRRRVPLVFVGALFSTAVVSQVAIAHPGRTMFADAAQHGAVAVRVSVTTKVEPAWDGAWRFSGDATGLGGNSGMAAPVTVLFQGARPDGLDLGAVVELTARGRPARPGERAAVALQPVRAPRVVAPPGGGHALASSLRRGFVELAAEFPAEGAQLMPGLSVGETSAVPAELDEAMKVTGLSHLTAVSGANCSLIVGAAYGVCALMRFRRGLRVAVAATALLAFVILVTPEPSVVRAAAMSGIGMLALLLGRPGAGLSLLSGAVVVLLILDPWLSMSVGFALSAAATGALLVIARPLSRVFASVLPHPLAVALAVPLSAQLVCAPILVLISPAVSIGGVVANLIAAPAAPMATVLGLLACLFAGVPGLGTALAALAWVPSQWIGSTARFLMGAPGVQIAWWEGFAGALVLGVIDAAIVLVIVRPRSGFLRAAATTVLLISVGVGGGLWSLRSALAPLTAPAAWSIAACDVGQGDAVLIRSSGRVALVDTGPADEPLDRCLRRLSVGRLDLLVLTHFDADHVGAARSLVGRVGTVLHGPSDGASADSLLRRFADGGADVRRVVAGDEGTLGAATWRVLWPRADTAPGNDASVVIDIQGDGVPRGLFLGDLSAEGQRHLLARHALVPSYAVVKVSHHGSADQLDALYDQLHATLAVVSVGTDNTYGHPRRETLSLLRRLGVEVARTDRAGMLLIDLGDHDQLRLWTEHSGTDPP